MSEVLKSHEQQRTPEASVDHIDKLQDIEKRAHESHHEHAEKIDTIRATIEHEAKTVERQHETPPSNERQPLHHYITKRIKADQYKRTLIQVQAHLPKSEKRFSKVIHQPAIEAVSEVGAKTIARPYSIIGGALFAIIGSFTVLAIAKHIGFEVPNSIFFMLFIVGYLLVLAVELAVRLLHKASPKHRRNRHTTSY